MSYKHLFVQNCVNASVIHIFALWWFYVKVFWDSANVQSWE